jgi:hypothetical protein
LKEVNLNGKNLSAKTRNSSAMTGMLVAGACFQLLSAQPSPPTSADQPLRVLSFLEGTWDAKTSRASSGIDASGAYTFKKELGGHILARYSSSAGCVGPADSDCKHGDLLYVYQDPVNRALKAIYFDNEGHVIHYDVSTPGPARAVFISDATAPGAQYRLTYELKGAVMQGRFQIRQQGEAEWVSYLEWSGAKK